jgi:YD repeat-containing protein
MIAAPAYAGTTTTYSYDALGRLTNVSTTGSVNNGAQMSTTYDAADNRVTYQVTGSALKAVIAVPMNGQTVIPVLDN